MCANEVSGLGQSRTTFTPEEQAELKARLEGAKTQAERSNIFTSYAKEVGVVVNVGTDTEVGAPQDRPVTGTVVEKNSPQKGNIKTTSTTTTKLPNDLYEDGKVSVALGNALKDVAVISQDGTVTLKSGITEADFKNALQKYLNNNSKSSTLPAEVSFPEGTDEKWKQHLVTEGALKKSEKGDSTPSYVVANADKLNELTTKIDEESGSTKETKNIDLDFTTTTYTEADNVKVPNGLAHNRKARNELKEKYEEKLKDWAQENPELRDEALANMKYGKQVDKRMAKMRKGKNGLQTPNEICKKYFDDYASQEEKIMYKTVQQEILKMKPAELVNLYNKNVDIYNAQKGEREKDLPKLSEEDFKSIAGDKYSQAKVNQNIVAITPLMLANSINATPDALLRKMAIKEVLADRTKGYLPDEAKQIIEDDERYFIKHMADREVQAKVTEQNVKNTTAHWNKASRKAAEAGSSNPEAIHTDIGKNGQKFVKAYPAQFGDRIHDNGLLREGVDYDFSDTITDPITNKTVTAYYKFNSEKWDAYWDMAADTRENVLRYAKDNHLTLKEARAQMLERNGGFDARGRRLSAESVLGNDNGKTGYNEVRKYRNLAKTTSRPVDKDRTNWKKAGHVFGNVASGAAIPFVSSMLGDLLTEYATIFVKVGGETYTVYGQGSGSYTVDETKWVTTTDHYIDKYGSTDITHNTPVNFHKKGTVNVETKTPFTTPRDNKKVNNNLETATGAAVIGGAVGLLHGIASMAKIQDQGTYWDGVINLDKEPVETVTQTRGTVQMTTERPFEVRQGEYSTEKEVDKYKAITYRGPEAYSGMYTTSDGKPVDPRLFAKAYKKATGCNTMTKSFFYAIPELEINGIKFVLKDDADNEYKKIKIGIRGTVSDKAINTPKTGEVHRGKVRRG